MSQTTHSQLYQLSNEIPWQDAAPGIQRQIFGYDEKIMLVKVKFEAGAVGTLHQHAHIQVSYVESGAFELIIDGNKKMLNRGDGFYVPPNAPHECLCLEAGVLIDVFTPCRADFL